MSKQKSPAGRRKQDLGIPIVSIHIDNDMNIDIHIDIHMNIDITPPHAEAVRRRGRGWGMGWGVVG